MEKLISLFNNENEFITEYNKNEFGFSIKSIKELCDVEKNKKIIVLNKNHSHLLISNDAIFSFDYELNQFIETQNSIVILSFQKSWVHDYINDEVMFIDEYKIDSIGQTLYLKYHISKNHIDKDIVNYDRKNIRLISESKVIEFIKNYHNISCESDVLTIYLDKLFHEK